jgi:hypothetical protein
VRCHEERRPKKTATVEALGSGPLEKSRNQDYRRDRHRIGDRHIFHFRNEIAHNFHLFTTSADIRRIKC